MTRAEVLSLAVMVGLNDSNRALGLSRTIGYTLARQGEYPVRVLRLGNQYRVPRADLLRFLGIDEPAADPVGSAAA
jgi:hypothetical protein